MSNINKDAVLNPFSDLTANILDYVPRATTSEFGIVAIGSGINVDALGRIYLDTQEYSDRLTAIEAEAASTLATQKSEVAAAIAQVNLTQSQTITSLTLEVNNLKTNLTDSITATQTDLINRADQLAQDVTDITNQLTQDKAAFTQEIQDALDYLKDDASVASALRTPRKINGTDFDGRSDITTNAWGATRTFKIGNKANSVNGTSNVDYSLADIGAFPEVGGTIQGDVEVTGNLSVDGTISATLEGTAASAARLQTPRIIGGVSFDGAADISLPGVNIAGNQNTSGNAATATKLANARTINGVSFDGSANITLPLASTSVSGTVQLNNTLTSTATDYALTAAQGKVLNDSKLAKTENAVSASKLQTSRTISLSGDVTGSISFDGSEDASIVTTITGLGTANGIATLDSSGQVPSTQLPSYVDDVLEYLNVEAFPSTGESGKIYVETTGNTTYRWSGTGYIKITSGEVSSVAGKTGVVTLTKSDVGLASVDNTADIDKPISTAVQVELGKKVGTDAIIAIEQGGTGATNKVDGLKNLGINLTGSELFNSFKYSIEIGDAIYPSLRLIPTNNNKNGVLFETEGNYPYLILRPSSSINDPSSNIVQYKFPAKTGVQTVACLSDFSDYLKQNQTASSAAKLVKRNIHTEPSRDLNDTRTIGAAFLEQGIGSEVTIARNFPESGKGTIVWQLGEGNSDSRTVQLSFPVSGGYSEFYFRSADWSSGYGSHKKIRHSGNTTIDSNGFIKSASPIIELYAQNIEQNEQAKKQQITFEKLGVGDYLIKGSTGFAQQGWYVEQPKDANGNVYHAVEYGTYDNGDIWIKTYEVMTEETRIVADHSKPVDIKENRFISIRLHEEPITPPEPDPIIVDKDGNPAPSRLHELVGGVWIITDENAEIIEQERLAAMQPLKRRQFRLTLAMNGYALNDIEALINQIEDPMQRTIAQIEWQDATDFERTNPTLLMMAELMQLTSEQVDQLWEYGLTL